jgi:ATP-dependent protease Clp ATPase subunit
VPRAHECAFCGKEEREVERLIAGTSASICNECLALCRDILADGYDAPAGSPAAWAPTKDELEELRQLGDELRRDGAWTSSAKRRTSNAACSFCGKVEADVHTLIAGAQAYICEACVRRETSAGT